jgi:hypothetical protein
MNSWQGDIQRITVTQPGMRVCGLSIAQFPTGIFVCHTEMVGAIYDNNSRR